MILECAVNPGVYRVHAETLTAQDILDAADGIMQSRYALGANVGDPSRASNLFRYSLGGCDQEVFAVAFLDSSFRIIKFEKMFFGTINQCTVPIREVVRRALILNATHIMVGHCHPCGDNTPSEADITMTGRLVDACNLVGMTVIDHFVVGKQVFSFRDNKLVFI
jgi:DNA repair protein RadC